MNNINKYAENQSPPPAGGGWGVIVIFFLLFFSQCITPAKENNKLLLWYAQPATVWEEALPIGNGRLGAMVFGNPANEHLQFNEETLWDCGPREYQRPGASAYLDEIRQLIADNKQDEAEKLANEVFMGKRAYEDNYPEKKAQWLKRLSENELLAESLNPLSDDSGWPVMEIDEKSVWETKGLPDLDGCLVFRKTVYLPDNSAGKELILNMGKIKDHDVTYFNGVKVGEIDGNNANRIYTIPAKLVKAGENNLAVQIMNYEKTGGFNAVRSGYKKMHLTPAGKDEPVFIEGEWKYRIVDDHPPHAPQYQADYQPFGDLRIETPGHENYTDYHRSLNLTNAVATTEYEVDGIIYKREYFATNPDQAVIVNYSANNKGAISFVAWLETPHPENSVNKVNDHTISLNLKVRDGVMTGVAQLQLDITNGEIFCCDNKIEVKNADEATLKLVAATNFVNYKDVSADPVSRCSKYQQAIESAPFKSLKKRHIEDYRKFFDRFDIDLGNHQNRTIPTDERIKNILTSPDNDLAALYIQYSRYLMISSGRAGTNPPNLQGIWNKDMFPAWGSKYTTNINCEMNFWGVETLNLPECHQSLFDMIDDLVAEGEKTAKVHYNANGWVHHHNTDQWRGTAPINNADHGIWVSGGAWLAHHYWEHFLYTGDTALFVSRGLPAIKGASQFFADFLVKDAKTGYLISTPSNSPENGGLVAGPAMDHQIIRSLFKIALEANGLFTPDDKEFETLIQSKLDKVAPDHIGRLGQLQEWLEDIDDPNNKHRHVSHLWGVYPGNEITWEKTPKLMDAAQKSLIMRGDEGTGWSLAWKINFWARFLDGEHAHQMVQMLLAPAEHPGREVRGGSYPNLFDAHPPFQIDGNFGGAAGMVEMIMQSHQGYIELLPALPDQWEDGSIKGLCARGGFEINMEWKNGRVEKLTIISKLGNTLRIKYNGQYVEIPTKKGEVIKI
ncbi:MAG: glycoside hydrolase family 95 protein [Prolixibacteraceae bacterium]|nr:glycoside hydrolase family 95 protein [Prolixibacteraceae bacterium]